MKTTEKFLIFEGAGWETAEHNGVGNCRIRTRIKNKYGRTIYLELSKYNNTHNLVLGGVNHCFYFDVEQDRLNNSSRELSFLENKRIPYNKKSILNFVNFYLDCTFTDVQVVNTGLRVHNTDAPLCFCEQVEQ